MATTTTTTTDLAEPLLLCRMGAAKSLTTLRCTPNAAQSEMLAELGMGPVTSGQMYWMDNTCRVTGDSYGAWYRDCNDANGFIVGRIKA